MQPIENDFRNLIEIKAIEFWILLLFKYLKTSQQTFSANFESHKKDFYSLTHETLESVSSSQTQTQTNPIRFNPNQTKAVAGCVQLS